MIACDRAPRDPLLGIIFIVLQTGLHPLFEDLRVNGEQPLAEASIFPSGENARFGLQLILDWGSAGSSSCEKVACKFPVPASLSSMEPLLCPMANNLPSGENTMESPADALNGSNPFNAAIKTLNQIRFFMMFLLSSFLPPTKPRRRLLELLRIHVVRTHALAVGLD